MSKLFTSAIILFCTFQLIIGLQLVSAQTIDLNAKCEILEDLKIKDTHILSASVVTDDPDLPKYCRVTGYVLPAINFEIRLPLEHWNDKFYMTGCGGLCGSVDSDSRNFYLGMNYGLKRNYAVSTMDAGHWGESIADGRWAMNNRGAEIDWAYRAVHETARVSKLVIEAFYGREPEKSYFNGCSTGGRMAVMEALRYPEDFDGIISGAPAIDYTGLAVICFPWIIQANTGPDGKDIVSLDDLKLIIDAVYQACDGIDGLNDGLISDPSACNFDPESLICDEGENKGCLTMEQIETLNAWYGGPKNSAGEQLYPGGLPLGSEPFWSWITSNTGESSNILLAQLSTDFLRYMAFQQDPGDSYNIADFDFDLDLQGLEYMAGIYNSDNPDLELYRKKGGKLLMYHGWADPAVPPWKSIEYYKEVEQRFGGREQTQDFFRLFMIPGMGHCGIGKALGITDDCIDPLTALEKWVEENDAPESLMFTKIDPEGNTIWERPVYPYPQNTE
jgi:pimeloyl-ACP methyl ester carboxylesterase